MRFNYLTLIKILKSVLVILAGILFITTQLLSWFTFAVIVIFTIILSILVTKLTSLRRSLQTSEQNGTLFKDLMTV